MELMSSLLLCALAALLSPSSGVNSEVKRLTAKFIEVPMAKTVWLKRKTQSELNLDMVLEYFRYSDQCYICIECINKALYAFSNTKSTPSPPQHMQSRDFLLNDIIENYHQYKVVRSRRDTKDRTSTKTKRDQISKSKNVTVTKYNIDGQIYAVKLTERNATNTENLQETSSCHVYSVKKHYPCDSPKAESILANPRIKSKNRSKIQVKNTLTTGKPQSQSLATRDKVIAEPFLTSIEELYN